MDQQQQQENKQQDQDKKPTLNLGAKEFKPKVATNPQPYQNYGQQPYGYGYNNNPYGSMDPYQMNQMYYMNNQGGMYMNNQGGIYMNNQGMTNQGGAYQMNTAQGQGQAFTQVPNNYVQTNQGQGNQRTTNQGPVGGGNLTKKESGKKEEKKETGKTVQAQPQKQAGGAKVAATASATTTTTKQKEKEEKKAEEKIKAIEVKNTELEDIDIGDSKEGTIIEVDEKLLAANIVFIGHVDAGKSTIAGNILFKTGAVDERTIEKFQKEAKQNNRESWFLAYIMDITEDERLKGKTSEVGKAFFKTQSRRFTILDAPGHAGYIADMLKGASQADFAGMVISAKVGEFEAGFEKDGRTREHAILAKSLGVSKLICMINKMDEESVKWSEERFNQIKSDLSDFFKKVGYKAEDVYWIPISGLTGDNLTENVSSHKCPWYSGPNFLELIDSLPVPPRDEHLPLRIPVLDRYKDAGMHVLGKIESGIVKLQNTYTLMPNNVNVKVDFIWNSEENGVRYAKPGEGVRLKIRGIENENEICSGSILCSVDNLCPAFQTFEAEVQFLELVEHKPIITNGYMCVLHIHTIEEECTIDTVLCQIEKKGEKKVKFINGYTRAKLVMTVSKMICADKFENFKSLGRFTLRDEGKTIGIGKILRYKKAK